jgi:hypothetical protein
MFTHCIQKQLHRLWRKPRQQTLPRRQALRLALECLEDRTVPSTLNIVNGQLNYFAKTNVSDNLTISLSGSTYTFNDTADTITLGSGTAGFTGSGTNTVTGPASSFTHMEPFFGSSFNTIAVQATAAPISVNDSTSTGQVHINLGNSTNGMQSIKNTVTDACFCPSAVSLDDSVDSTGRNVTVDSGFITGLAPGTIHLANHAATDLTIFGGSGGNTFNVLSTLPNVTTNLSTGTGNDTTNIQATGAASALNVYGQAGMDTVNIGSKAPNFGGTLANIHGALLISNVTGQTFLNLDDSGDGTANANVQVNADSIVGLGTGGASIDFSPDGIAALNVLGGSGGNVFTVVSTGASRIVGQYTTTLQCGAGNNTTYVEGASPNTNLVVDGEGGHDVVTIGSKGPQSGSTLAGLTKMTVAVGNSNGGHTDLTIDDSGDTGVQTAVLQTIGPVNNPTQEFAIPNYAPGTNPVQVTFAPAQLSSLTIDGGSANNTYNISDFGAGLLPSSILATARTPSR